MILDGIVAGVGAVLGFVPQMLVIKNGTELGKKAKTYMDQGALVPDELVVDLVVDRVAQEDAKNGYVLDGFPRTIPQLPVFPYQHQVLLT